MILASLTGPMTFREYLDAIESVEGFSEYVDGVARPWMTSPLKGSLISSRVLAQLSSQLVDREAQVLPKGTLVKASHADNAFFPDASVYVGEPEVIRHGGLDLLLNPVVLIEVPSPTTADYDHGTKWENYRRIPSLREYLLVSQDRPRVEQYTRHDEHFWMFSETEGLGSEIRIGSLNATLSLARIYAGLRLGAEDTGEASAE
jgi:Uma2 family endonuclease